ncbi:MAG: transcriptional repressor [Ruminococcaceae bacterium]|nr:transcriptional repressor [Oscillospiraceae bacterium]
MPVYMTKQRRLLMDFFEDHPDRLFSAVEIAENLSRANISISAVYRNLNAFLEKGLIDCVTKDGVREKYYRFLLSEECRSSIHLTCTCCNRSFHLDADKTDSIVRGALKNSGFSIDTSKSVLYGRCEKCK